MIFVWVSGRFLNKVILVLVVNFRLINLLLQTNCSLYIDVIVIGDMTVLSCKSILSFALFVLYLCRSISF